MATHDETHSGHRTNVLRAMVLGANDGIISTACLVLGVAAANASKSSIMTAGVASLVAGAASMALGEYVSVSSQRDTERADISKEKWELENLPERELAELTGIFESKGLRHDLARQVAVELTERDALAIHLAEELGITEHSNARPVEAAVSSAAAFSIGSAIPLLAMWLASESLRYASTVGIVVVGLALLGFSGARFGGAKPQRPIARVIIGGLIAMAITMAIGNLFGAAVA
ncbi:MAG: VIT1/CCC1 transporter family protein [Ilumatobacteraceae bacterium]